MPIVEDIFGQYTDSKDGTNSPVKRYTLRSKSNVMIQLMSYGATVCNVVMPDKNGVEDSITLGFDTFNEYPAFNYLGSSVGRHANRINKGKFTLNDKEYQLTINNNGNHLHGGVKGFDKLNWDSIIIGDSVVFSLASPDGDQGYPGHLIAQVIYKLDDDGSLHIDFKAMSTKPTPINMTNHAFFNLAGHGAGEDGLYEHTVQLNCDGYLEVSPTLIPTGKIIDVGGTPFDLRTVKKFGEVIPKSPDTGYDHCFCIHQKKRKTLEFAGRIGHPPSGRTLEVYTTEPGIQLYTGNFLPKEKGMMVGRKGVSYTCHGAFCAEPQNYPDAVNHVNFPNGILRPGDIYEHSIIYKFSTEQ